MSYLLQRTGEAEFWCEPGSERHQQLPLESGPGDRQDTNILPAPPFIQMVQQGKLTTLHDRLRQIMELFNVLL